MDMGIQVAIKIEEVLNSKFKDKKNYSDKARSLLFNLRDPKNPELKKKVLFEEYSPESFVTLSPKDLASKDLKDERQKLLKENLDARRTDWNKE